MRSVLQPARDPIHGAGARAREVWREPCDALDERHPDAGGALPKWNGEQRDREDYAELPANSAEADLKVHHDRLDRTLPLHPTQGLVWKQKRWSLLALVLSCNRHSLISLHYRFRIRRLTCCDGILDHFPSQSLAFTLPCRAAISASPGLGEFT